MIVLTKLLQKCASISQSVSRSFVGWWMTWHRYFITLNTHLNEDTTLHHSRARVCVCVRACARVSVCLCLCARRDMSFSFSALATSNVFHSNKFQCVPSEHFVHVHDDVMKWKHFPRYRPFVRGIHRPLVNSPDKDQQRGALIIPLFRAWINGWVNNLRLLVCDAIALIMTSP